MDGNTTRVPTSMPSYLVYDRSDPGEPRFVVACGWWSIPAAEADMVTPALGTPVGDWLASLSRANFEWTGDAIDADQGRTDVPESTTWATPLDHIGTLPDKLDPGPDDLD